MAIAVFFANGYEEIEALTVVDLTRRAGIETWMVSITDEKAVTGSHGITVSMDKTLKEVEDSNGEIIMFIDELHIIVGAGKTDGAMDAGNMLKPMLARGEIHCIGATTLNEYRKYIEKDGALERRFQKVLINEPTVSDTIAIFKKIGTDFELNSIYDINEQSMIPEDFKEIVFKQKFPKLELGRNLVLRKKMFYIIIIML